MEEVNAEKVLFEKLKQGDIVAFEHFLTLYEKQIFNYIRRIMGNTDDVEDITQETFIKIYKKRASIDGSKSVKSWLYTIATNTCYDYLRKKKRQRELLTLDNPDIPDEIPETIKRDTAYLSIESHIASQDIEHALAIIPQQYSSVLLLYYREDLSYEEISTILTIPLNTVKTYIHRGKKALAKVLESTYNA